MHLTEKALIARALGYGKEKLARHLAACAHCRARLQELEAVLGLTAALPAPEPEDAFTERIWSRLAPRLIEPAPPAPMRRIWVLAPVLAILLLLAWVVRLPRVTAPVEPQPAAAAPVAPSPVLLLAVSRHLDRTQALLVELGHSSGPEPGQQQAARELLASNRLYQQGAGGDAPISALLAGIEPTLIELAHTPARVSPVAWRQLQSRVAASGLLFKVRVVDQTLQSRLAARVPQEQDGTL